MKVTVGWIMMIGAVAMMAAPLAALKDVISMNSLESMPLHLSAACFINGFTWCLYGTLLDDMFIAIPNGLGAMCGLAQLYVWVLYSPFQGSDYLRQSTGSRSSEGLKGREATCS